MGFRRQLISLAGAAAALAGCNTTNPEAVQTVAQPKTPVAKTLTSFTHAKTCMDHLLRQYGKTNILLTSDGVPDQTGQVSAGTRDMLIKALDDMSRTSHAFRFVDIDHTGLSSVFWIQNQVNQSFSVPPFYIRGSISQVDRNVTSDSIGGSISLPVVSIGASKDQIGSIITIDLQVGDLVKRQVIPGVTTTNTITVISKGQGLSADGLINQGAVSISLDNYTEEGTHQAIRTLLDYSLIELMGKFTKVPYQRCLELDSTDPAVMAGNRADFDRLKPAERLQAVQRALIAAGEYSGPADGILNRRFRDVLNIAKANRNLIPNGRIDFDIFNALANEGFLVFGPDDRGCRRGPPRRGRNRWLRPGRPGWIRPGGTATDPTGRRPDGWRCGPFRRHRHTGSRPVLLLWLPGQRPPRRRPCFPEPVPARRPRPAGPDGPDPRPA